MVFNCVFNSNYTNLLYQILAFGTQLKSMLKKTLRKQFVQILTYMIAFEEGTPPNYYVPGEWFALSMSVALCALCPAQRRAVAATVAAATVAAALPDLALE